MLGGGERNEADTQMSSSDEVLSWRLEELYATLARSSGWQVDRARAASHCVEFLPEQRRVV